MFERLFVDRGLVLLIAVLEVGVDDDLGDVGL